MKSNFSNPWRWSGTIERGPYALIGVVGCLLKYNMDRAVAYLAFGKSWSPRNYLVPGQQFNLSSRDDMMFCVAMLALALPFIWIGVGLTLRRLRATDLPRWMVILFFIPLIQWVFLALLCIWPSCDKAIGRPPLMEHGKGMLNRIIPHAALGAAALGLLVTALLGLGAAALSVTVFVSYGIGLFVLVPFCVGLFSVVLYGYHGPRSLASCLGVASLAITLLGAVLIAVAFEGLVCIVMAAPIAIVLALLGGAVGYLIQERPWNRSAAPGTLSVIVLALPLLIGVERAQQPVAPLFAVRSAIEVDAAPAQVWRNVVAFAELPPPREWLFRAGIAYPMRAQISGHGVGAIRHCVFSTGAFVEPIEVWDEPRLLKFSVTANPPPMEEWTPYKKIQPPHLDGFLQSRGGQFQLTPLPGGRTRLEGTTWYQDRLWPASYWKLWSDAIIHRIHLRVLQHIKRCAETNG